MAWYRRLALLLACAALLQGGLCADEVLLQGGERRTGETRSVPEGLAVKTSKGEEVVPWGRVEWTLIRSKNFLFRSQITPEKTRAYAEAMEYFARALSKTFKFDIPSVQKNWTRQVRIFRDERDYARYERDGEEGPPSSCGYFWVDHRNRLEEVVIHDMARDPAETFDTLLHEATHLLLHLWGRAKEFDFPIWIDEGMAEYFGGSTFRPAARSLKEVFTQGAIKAMRLLDIQEQLRKGEAEPLQRLFLMDRGDFEVKHYAQSWSLVHFLANHKKGVYAPLLFKYCQDLQRTVREGTRALQLFDKTFGRAIPDLEGQWKAYVLGLEPRSAEDWLALADAYEQLGEPDKCLPVLERLLAADPDDYRALVIKARALSWKAAYPEAFESLDRARQLQPRYPLQLRCRALLCHEADKIPEALESFAAYFALEPFDLVASLEYVRCLATSPPPQRDPARALAIGERVLAYHRDWELFDLAGDAALECQQYARAKELYTEAMALVPEDWPGPRGKGSMREAIAEKAGRAGR